MQVLSVLGHSLITVTLDRYGHLMPGNERQAAALVEDYPRRRAPPGLPR